MKKKSSRIALLAFIVVALVVVGVAVWPAPKPALAANWPVQLTLQWAGNARNVNATAQLYDALGAPIGGVVQLGPSQGWTIWTATISDGGATPSYVVFSWDYNPAGADLDWIWEDANGNLANPPGQATVNTAGTNLWRERVWNG